MSLEHANNWRSAQFHWIQKQEIFRKLDDDIAHLTVTPSSHRDNARTRQELRFLRVAVYSLGLHPEKRKFTRSGRMNGNLSNERVYRDF